MYMPDDEITKRAGSSGSCVYAGSCVLSGGLELGFLSVSVAGVYAAGTKRRIIE